MVFQQACFIKAPEAFVAEYRGKNQAPLFRKTFTLAQIGQAQLRFCALGCGCFYLNGHKVTEDLFLSAMSDYYKTLWYHTYDVTHLLKVGENVLCAELGNGWYNEEIKSVWHQDEAPWRDNPKCILELQVEGQTVLCSDDSWQCLSQSATYFNQMRMGEYFDARLFDARWVELRYNTEGWEQAVKDPNPPKGMFRPCDCEGIREQQVFAPKTVTQVGEQKYIFDFGQNMSGYVRLTTAGQAGDEITVTYEEELDPSMNLRTKIHHFYKEGAFATDRFICSGQKCVWNPKFAYHGFRYAVVEGIRDIADFEVEAVFVHQDIPRRTTFSCSDALLNQMFEAGVISTYSNLFYSVTDCPTREKYGWTNDAQASAEQILTDFASEKLLAKWMQDILDAQRADGEMPGIVPTCGWGYDSYNGPVCGGVLFELPLRLFMHTGNDGFLIEALPYFEKYLKMLDTRRNAEGLVEYGLDDWANYGFKKLTPATFINSALIYSFYQIAALAARRKGVSDKPYADRAAEEKARIQAIFIQPDGRCALQEQTAVAMLLYYDLYTDFEVSKAQLVELIAQEQGRHRCGMVGLRRLLHALSKCGRADLAYKVLTAEGVPGYKAWFSLGATTLWEVWDAENNQESKNHHMYSDFMSWIIKNILGIRLNLQKLGQVAFQFAPAFFEGIDHAEGCYHTPKGKISVQWVKKDGQAEVKISKASGVELTYLDQPLPDGESVLKIDV